MKEIVIKLHDDDYNRIMEYGLILQADREIIADAVKNGTLLPKGHGRLIDADALNRKNVNCANVPMNFIDTAPTIIEADKGDKNES